MNILYKNLIFLSLVLPSVALAGGFTLSSKNIADGKLMSKTQEFQGFGCSGGDKSPQLSWSGAPKGTKTFAIFAFDPDAPTGSGWWHWQVVNIPKHVTSLPAGAGALNSKLLPKGAMEIRNDYGIKAFGGACPPKGDAAHHYQFTIYALPKKLTLPKDASSALTSFMVRANAIGQSRIVALYKRD